MRNTLPLSFRTPVSIGRARSPTPVAATPPPVIPTIKLTAATPSVAGTPSSDTSLVSTILAPKPPGETRKKVVPKKSKMGLLSVGSKKQEKGKDLSDVKRRVGVSSSSTSRSFDIYVDPTDDPDIGEVVFVQKKKSRAGLDGIFKAALGDVTNTNEEKVKPEPKVEKTEKAPKSLSGTLKVKEKREEKEKWWTIGRSRKDSKEKAKEKGNEEKAKLQEVEHKVKSDVPEPILITDSRQRAHSFDSGILLNTPTTALSQPSEKPLPEVKDEVRPPTVRINTSPTMFGSRPGTPTSTTLLSPPSAEKPQSGSIALRAMRSIARIGSWAQLRNTPSPESSESSPDDVKKEKKIFGKTKRTKSVRSAVSSFEAGGLTPVSGIFNQGTVRTNKSSTGTIMTVSSLQSYASGGSSGASVSSGGHRLSVASSVGTVSSGSCKSTIEPILANGRQSKRNSGSSVRWDDQLDTVKDKKVDTKTGRESRGKVEGRRRPAISALFPDAMASKPVEQKARATNPNRPLLTLSAASPDRNYDSEMEVLSMSSMSSHETPVKKPRPRPMSENMLGRVRPRAVTGDDVEGGFMTILDAATTDLANLINRLDLQATPDASPMGTSPGTLRSVYSSGTRNDDTGKFSLPESPSKRAMKSLSKESSVSSLRPYTSPKSKLSAPPQAPPQASKLQIGEQIAPWPAFSSHLETLHETSPVATTQPKPAFRLSHKRTLSPPAPAMDPLPVFHPLPAAKAKNSLPAKSSSSPTSTTSDASTPRLTASIGGGSFIDASSQTFGVRPSRVSNGIRETQDSPTAAGRLRTHERKRSSLVPFDVDSNSGSVLMDSTARRALGMRGTMGSVGSTSGFDPDEPDSDIPDELHVILCASRRNSACSTLDVREDIQGSSLPPSPGVPPSLPLPNVAPVVDERLPELPIFRALVIDDEQHEADIDETSDSSDDDGKSFDFTGEIKILNESGAAERRSFVLQLEDAFKTQAQIDIDGLGAHLGLHETAPQVPPLPAALRPEHEDDDSALPSLSAETRLDDLPLKTHLSRDHLRGITSKASDGKLNRDFKFGGRPTSPSASPEYVMEKPVTLSDIIPPLSHIEHVRSQSMSSLLDEDNSVLQSIYAQAVELPKQEVPELPPMPADARLRLESDSSDKQRARQEALSQLTAHSRQESEVSFSGMSSFDEVRRGFEFNGSQPVFYPPSNPSESSNQSHRFGHGQQESVFSIASVSSYGAVLTSGAVDPFGYALPTRPMSGDMSMSMSVDDTFSFLRRDPARQRVDSDASSFYFNSSRDVSKRHRRQNDSMASAFSGPPVSMYNRSYAAHRKSDSSTSASSIAHAYGAFGANGGRAAWAHHQRDFSVDSAVSGYSARLGRPGVGDKMFESAREYGQPLTSISASPSQSVDVKDIGNRTSFDSILDTDRRSSMDDSLFDETGRRTSVSSASVFGYESHHPLPRAPGLLPPHQFRPLSFISVGSSHGTKAEDDTMITMLGGGHVRRRSIGSTFDGSPCVRARHSHRKATVNFNQSENTSDEDTDYASIANKAQVVQKPSVASSMSHQFGEERMTMAQKGLLQRQSLEDSCLSGEGEDMSFSAPLVFRRPSPTSHPRDSQSSLSSGVDTPPLSISDTSSISSGSQCSIDIGRLSALLANSTVPSSTTAQARARARARGQGHRRRISQAQASRSRNSVYETIEEEEGSGMSNAASPIKASLKDASSPVSRVSIYDPEVHGLDWDQEEVGPALRRYFALRNEAYETVHASQQLWADTPFSIFALQSFEPPEYPHGMQAVLEHSQKTYVPLPSELRALRRRSRTLSRPSPYPRSRKTSESSLHSRKSSDCGHLEASLMQQLAATPLQDLPVNRIPPPVPQSPAKAPALNPLNPFTPFAVKFNGDKSLAISEKDLPVRAARPRVASNARRTALGWSKRNTTKTASENKENSSFGAMMSPNESLRIVRPRPRGRATPSSRAVRV